MLSRAKSIEWLRLIRIFTQYIAPVLAAVALVMEATASSKEAAFHEGITYNLVLASVFSLLTVAMIAICGWTLFLWDIDRLFFKLENKLDAQAGGLEGRSRENALAGSMLGRARDKLNRAVREVRTEAVALIEKAYWDDINAGGVLAFPQPDIAAAVAQIDKSRRDLLVPLTELVARAIPLGNMSATFISRLIFRFVAPEVKVRLYRRLILRFLAQLGALFALTTICFYISILAWSRASGIVFSAGLVSSASVFLYQLDLMLRGALFDFMEHTHRSVSPITINQNATAFVYYTLTFRMFVAVYIISSLFRVSRFVVRRWRPLLRR